MSSHILYLHAGAEMYGADKVLLDLISNLNRDKYVPHVVLPADGVLVSSLADKGVDVEVFPYPVMRRKYFNPKGIVRYASGLFDSGKYLARYCESKCVDLIHVNTAAVIEGCSLKCKLSLPLVWSIHEIINEPRAVYRATSYLISRYSDIVTGDSNAVVRHLIETGYFKNRLEDVRVIHNGVDEKRFIPGIDTSEIKTELCIPSDAKVVGMMGRVNSWKGQGDFVEAMEIVMSCVPDVYAVLVGSSFEGEEWRERELAKRIESSDYRDRFVNLGYRSDSERLYSLFDVFVLPSIQPDPFPTVVLENMSCGNPIVGYRHGGITEMVVDGHNGYLADVRNTTMLADKILLLLSNENLRSEMGKNARERLLSNFSMSSYVSKMSAIYDRLLDDIDAPSQLLS